jgi:integrase
MLIAEERKYEPNPFAFGIEASANSGLRAAELPCLLWSDIRDGFIHVHLQQRLIESGTKRLGFEIIDTTKNEKGISRGGRQIPITSEMQRVLTAIHMYQEKMGLETDLIFCNGDGSMIEKTGYELYLRRHCKKLGFSVTNNHALRMSFNSNILIPAGLDVRERALIMGHSVETNERNYSHAGTYLLQGIMEKLNNFT